MTVHLQKLCVGADSVEDLESWIARRVAERRRAGQEPRHWHVTRMTPARTAELLPEGSLYWVIKGTMQARQRLLAIEPFRDADGIRRCRLVLEPRVYRTLARPRRAFQGWRYLEVAEAPPDLGSEDDTNGSDIPLKLRRELAELGLW